MEHKSFKEELLRRIEGGEVKMTSRWYFVLKSLLYGLLVLFTMVVTVFMVTFVFYTLKINGLLALTQFGLKGMRDFLLSLPLTLLLITIIFCAVAGVFLKEYPVTYRRPLIYAVGALLLIFSGGLAVLVETPELRRGFYAIAEGVRVPILSNFYEAYKTVDGRNVVLGRVTQAGRNDLIIVTRDREVIRVAFSSETSLYTDREVREGDYVIVHGRRNGGVIGAFVVERVRE